ncbi:hypothetical protein ACNKHR_18090 [Shigella flexneri]
MPGERVNGAVAQETTANTVRLPYSFSRRFSVVAWCEASLEILHVHPLSLSVLQELQRGAELALYAAANRRAEFEQRLNAVWQRDSSEARQLMEDSRFCRGLFYPRGRTAGNGRGAGKRRRCADHQTDERSAGRGD